MLKLNVVLVFCIACLVISCDENSIFQDNRLVDYFPMIVGSVWIYDIDYSNSGDRYSHEGSGEYTLELMDIESVGGAVSYNFEAVFEGTVRTRSWGWPGGYDTTYQAILVEALTIDYIDGKLQAQEASHFVANPISRMFNYVNPERFYPTDQGSVTLVYSPQGGYGTEIVLNQNIGLEKFWCDSGGVLLGYKEYVDITLDNVRYTPGE